MESEQKGVVLSHLEHVRASSSPGFGVQKESINISLFQSGIREMLSGFLPLTTRSFAPVARVIEDTPGYLLQHNYYAGQFSVQCFAISS